MNTDPYSVLGVSPSASDEDIKSAYRNLAKKYHPDNYSGAPDIAEVAAEKMAQINEAYDTIMSDRKKSAGSSSNSSGYGGARSGSSNSYASYTYSGSQHTDFADVRNLLRDGRVTDAEILLDGVPANRRNAEWYFLKGTILYRRGWIDQAYAYLETALKSDPNNVEYQSAFNQVSQQRSGRYVGYHYEPRSSSRGDGCSPCSTCVGLICADSCCECFGGDIISCI